MERMIIAIVLSMLPFVPSCFCIGARYDTKAAGDRRTTHENDEDRSMSKVELLIALLASLVFSVM